MLLVQNTGAPNSGGSGTIAFTSNVTAGNLLLVIQLPFNTGGNAPTDSLSNTWVNVIPSVVGPGGAVLSVWAAIANASGACTVSYSGFPSANEAAIMLEEWSGVEVVSYAGSISGTTGTLVCVNKTTPLTTQSGIAVLFAWQDSNTNPISVSPGTNRQAFSISSGGYAVLADTTFPIQSSFAAFSVTWTTGGTDTVAGMLFLSAASGGGSAANSSFAS